MGFPRKLTKLAGRFPQHCWVPTSAAVSFMRYIIADCPCFFVFKSINAQHSYHLKLGFKMEVSQRPLPYLGCPETSRLLKPLKLEQDIKTKLCGMFLFFFVFFFIYIYYMHYSSFHQRYHFVISLHSLVTVKQVCVF